jgi:hypothetical protein
MHLSSAVSINTDALARPRPASSYYASTASVQNGTAIVGDGDYQAYLYTMRPRGVGMMRRAAGHQGAIWVSRCRSRAASGPPLLLTPPRSVSFSGPFDL